MPTEKKEKAVESLREIFAKSNIGIMTDYRGLKTAELNELRRKLKEADVEYKIVKNSLAQIAARNTGMDYMEGAFQGPTAVAFGYGEVTVAIKTLAEYIRVSKSNLKITGGFLEDKLLTAQELDTLSRLPSRDVLLAKVIGGMQSPLYGLVNVLSGPIRGLAQVLQGRIRQLEAE
jgi:large subunit ribosomal protein L10